MTSDSRKFFPARSLLLKLKRFFQPPGICIAVLGSDGSGKSTLLTNLKALLEPHFSEQHHLHFRPKILAKRTHDSADAIASPHGRSQKGVLSSWLRVLYYFIDFWAGWFLIVRPARRRGALVIFDRDFDDLLIDEKRYRLKGTRPLVRVLRHFIPGPQRTFILLGPASLLHSRKPELPWAELERQRSAFLELAKTSSHYKIVSVAQPPDTIAKSVCRRILRMTPPSGRTSTH